jgi:hypothetical protein
VRRRIAAIEKADHGRLQAQAPPSDPAIAFLALHLPGFKGCVWPQDLAGLAAVLL